MAVEYDDICVFPIDSLSTLVISMRMKAIDGHKTVIKPDHWVTELTMLKTPERSLEA